MNRIITFSLVLFLAFISLFSQDRQMDEQQAGILAKKYYREMGKAPQQPQHISPREHGTEAMQQQSMIGHTANEAFGISVASAGDVNGDGYIDILVGASRYATYKGRVYLYFGGNQINNTADVIFTGEFENDNFGWSVASAGDMNGDGFADMLVGAYGYGGGEGKAYVFYGGTVIDYTPDIVMYGGVSNSFLGTSVAGAGDVNGDGYADVIAGANGAVGNSGRAYIYYGGQIGNGVADVTLSGDAGYFGSTVAGISDINGDGYADVAVGEHPYNSNTGGVYIFHGGAAMDNTADLAIMGNTTGSYFGKAIASGDINGDGYPDIVIGAYGYSSSVGIVNIYNGGPDMDPYTDLTLWGEANNGCFGSALACSDINSDGFSDIIVGAFGINANKGKVFGFWGGAHPDNSPDIKIDGEAAGNFFGASVAAAGDLNLDGNEDFICGAYFHGGGRGKIYFYKNSLAGYDIPDMSIAQAGAGRLFGYTVSNSGDVNGDGFDDILVGAPGAELTAGNAYLYFGGPSMDNVSDLTFTGDSSYFGSIMAGKGDINGDGISDVVISDYNYDRCRGKVYVYLGGQFIDNISDYTMTGDSIYRYFGYALDKSGDVNGDGYNDLVVSGPGSAGSYGNPYVHSF
ncbi:MAG: FG-GAP repeat protein [Ignavibacteriales bacterium]|nr:FG-GAP repeat protein [Ignavibacteriales bacterium]